jgi:hypothetical protein
MDSQRLFGLLTAGIALAALPAANAVEALSTAELKSHCEVYEEDPDGEDGIFCVRYIQGFIDGAVVTDERVTYNVADEADRDESFTERAIRTRVGSRLDRYGPSVYADFCLGEPVPLAEVVKKVVDDLLNETFVREMPLARDIVYATLRRNYPCEERE